MLKYVNTGIWPTHIRDSMVEAGYSNPAVMLPGDTIRMNHQDCPAGEDTRGRLYVTRFENSNKLGWYCHNCSQGGGFNSFTSDRDIYRTPVSTLATEVDKDKAIRTLKDQEECIVVSDKIPYEDLPIGAIVYLDKYKIARPIYERHNITYNFATNAIETYGHDPLNHNEPRYAWIQKRRLDKLVRTKYIQERSENFSGIGSAQYNGYEGNILVICEDYISAVRIAEANAELIGGHNFGVQVKALEWARFIDARPKIDSVVIWFDNDGEIPKENAMALARVIKASYPHFKVKVIDHLFDPKKYTDNEIRDAVLWK